jgi:anaerobic selenocysteine-containing dehydrogenase
MRDMHAAMSNHTYCRLCDASCGLLAEVAEDRILSLQGDPTDPVSLGFACDVATRSPGALRHPARITTPMRRVDGKLTPATWAEAIEDIGKRLRDTRSRGGARSVGVYLGAALERSSRAMARSLAFGVGMGTPNLFSEQCLRGGPRTVLTELMLGHPAALQVDVGRAHYVLMLGGNQRDFNWGPLMAGMAHERWLQHSRKTKGTKVVVADPRKTDLAGDVDQHLAIRPGTELFLLLGMLSAAVKGNWGDEQYLRDYSTNLGALGDALAPWTVERCAGICGIDAATLSGVALKFTRAAMGVVQPASGTFLNAHPALTAWAWLALHTVSANTLRPGGLWENKSIFDLNLAVSTIPTATAPRTRGGHALHLLQAPATALVEEASTPGEGQLRALVCVEGDPLGTLPGSGAVRAALDGLELLVCIGRHESATAARAHWVLPAVHPWEREDIHFFDAPLLPFQGSARTPALVAPAGEARPVEDILAELFSAVRPGLRGGAWGLHVGVLAQAAARADLGHWERRVVEQLGDEAGALFDAPPYRVDRGESDRATWRPSRPDHRIDLLPDAIAALLARLEAPAPSADFPHWLRTATPADRAPDALHRAEGKRDPGVRLHPDHGIAEGARVRVSTRHGSVVATAHLDPSLRADTVDLPAGYAVDALSLLDAGGIDALTGAPQMDGLGCRVEAL